MKAKQGPEWIEILGGNVWRFGATDNKLTLTIEQLAKALSQINRFTGHTTARWPYTVAQHSVFVSELLDLDPVLAMAGLMHDAPEIIIGDVTTPVKWFLGKEKFAPLKTEEHRAYGAIMNGLGVAHTVPAEWEPFVKHADLIALVTEKRDLLNAKIQWNYYTEIPRHHRRIVPVSCQAAAKMFVRRFRELKRRLEE